MPVGRDFGNNRLATRGKVSSSQMVNNLRHFGNDLRGDREVQAGKIDSLPRLARRIPPSANDPLADVMCPDVRYKREWFDAGG
jgi:hypothetical protein